MAEQQSAEHALMDAAFQFSFAVTAVLTQVGAEHDLSLTQLRMLGILRDRQPTMSDLADRLGLDRSSVSGLIDRASRRDLVQRVASDVDRRSSLVALTAHGARFAAELESRVYAGAGALLRGLDSAERADLTRLLLRVVDPLAG